MKTLPLKNLFLSNASLKIMSLFLGYCFWHIASTHQIITTTMTIPLCFIAPDDYIITAPEKISVTLKGKRIDLYSLDTDVLAAHITLENISIGTHGIIIKENHLFLPHTVSLVHYKPSNVVITVTKK